MTFTSPGPDNNSIRKTADALEDLVAATKEFNKETSQQTKQMVILTTLIASLTVVLVLGLFVQIVISWPR